MTLFILTRWKALGFMLSVVLFFYQCTEEATISPDSAVASPNDSIGAPGSSPSPNALARARVIQDYKENYLAADAFFRNWSGDEAQCEAGSLPPAAYAKVLQQINYYRRQVGLNDNITFDEEKNKKCQQAALMMMANSKLDHSPPEDWKCYTKEGAQAAGKSNLGGGYRSARAAIDGYMRDTGVESLGHRRWIIYSRAQEFGFGSTSSHNALWVIGGEGDNPEVEELDYIAWPPAGYVIDRLVFPTWSFSIPKANFSESEVTMTGPGGNIKLSFYIPQKGFGDNAIAWNPEQGQIESEKGQDVTYEVTVSKVKLEDKYKDFNYKVVVIEY